jgi:hypothetical protein
MIDAGATPKLTISASESNSLPILEYARSIRAANPSKKSKTEAAIIKYAAITVMPSNENTIDRHPHNRLRHVITLGTQRKGDIISDIIC